MSIVIAHVTSTRQRNAARIHPEVLQHKYRYITEYGSVIGMLQCDTPVCYEYAICAGYEQVYG